MKSFIYINSAEEYFSAFAQKLVDYSPKVISALFVLVVGLYAIKFINRFVKGVMVKRALDPTLSKFLADSLLWALRILLFVTFISRLGIETSSFVAILGAAGLAIGLSLQGSLSNFAGGMLIILFKPFRVGDSIEAQGVSGTVVEIQIFVTKLITGTNQTIFVPNGVLSNGTIVNYSMEKIRKAELSLSLSYDTDIRAAKEIITDILLTNKKVLKTPAPVVAVTELSQTAIVLGIKPWSTNEDFSDMTSEILESCKSAFDAAGLSIQPYNIEMSKSAE